MDIKALYLSCAFFFATLTIFMAYRNSALRSVNADLRTDILALQHELKKLTREEPQLSEKPASQEAKPKQLPMKAAIRIHSPRTDWGDLSFELNYVLSKPNQDTFKPQLLEMCDVIRTKTFNNQDGALLALFYESQDKKHHYAALHSILTSVICGIASSRLLKWTDLEEHTLCLAALVMNIGMHDEQNLLSNQSSPPNETQKEVIARHPQASVEMLKKAGFDDPVLLTAIKYHHVSDDDFFFSSDKGLVMASLIRCADIYGAGVSPRAGRKAMSNNMAAKNIYFGNKGAANKAAECIIKAIGLLPPGVFIKLESGEQAVVLKPSHPNKPGVMALLTDHNEIPLTRPRVIPLNQQTPIKHRLTREEIKIALNTERLMALAD